MDKDEPLYDILMVADNRSIRVPEGAAGALVRYMAAKRIAVPVDEALADTWCEVYSEAGDSAHDAFVKGGYDGPKPVFAEAVVRWGTEGCDMPYGGMEGEQIYFFVEFRGARFDTVLGLFRNKIKDIVYIRPRIFVRSHEELLPHLEVPEGRALKDKRLKKSPSGGLAGTRVEEY